MRDLLLRVQSDADLAELVRIDPDAAARDYDLSDDELAALRRLDASLYAHLVGPERLRGPSADRSRANTLEMLHPPTDDPTPPQLPPPPPTTLPDLHELHPPPHGLPPPHELPPPNEHPPPHGLPPMVPPPTTLPNLAPPQQNPGGGIGPHPDERRDLDLLKTLEEITQGDRAQRRANLVKLMEQL